MSPGLGLRGIWGTRVRGPLGTRAACRLQPPRETELSELKKEVLRDRVMRLSRCLWFLVLIIMVAEGVYAGDPSGTKDFNIGRAFAHCTKLTKNNYDLWVTGLISTIVGITGVKTLKSVKSFFEYFEKNGGKDESTIETALKALVAGADEFDETRALMYTIILSHVLAA